MKVQNVTSENGMENSDDLKLNVRNSDSQIEKRNIFEPSPSKQKLYRNPQSSGSCRRPQDTFYVPATRIESDSPLMWSSNEYISIMPGHTAEMILYVNPKVLVSDGSPGAWTSMSSFLKSEMDLELEAIFQHNPPVVSGLIIGQLGGVVTSGLNVDTYRSTTDLEHMGHASYFLGNMTPAERAAIGLKPSLNVNHWTGSRRRTAFWTIPSPELFSNCTESITRKICAAFATGNGRENIKNNLEHAETRLTWIGRVRRRFPQTPKWNFLKRIFPSCGKRTFRPDAGNSEDNPITLTRTSSTQAFRLPLPIMVPVLTRNENVWFFGNQTPIDHELVIVHRKKEIRHEQFSRFHQKAYKAFAEDMKDGGKKQLASS